MSGSHLPKSRLNHIAQRKLTILGVKTTLSSDENVLEGILPLKSGQLLDPFTKQAIGSACFVAHGHDHIQFLSPPVLRGLHPLPFYDLGNLDELIGALDALLRRRFESLINLRARMRQLGFGVELDGERGLVVRAELNPTMGTVVLEGDGRGLFATELIPRESSNRGLKPFALGRVPVEFARLADRVDLELFLSDLVERARLKPTTGQSTGSQTGVADTGELELRLATADLTPNEALLSAPKLQMTLAPRRSQAHEATSTSPPLGSLTLSFLTEKVGGDALVGSGVAIVRELTARGEYVRFEAKHVEGLTFFGSVSTSKSTLWSERFNLEGFPGVERFVQILLGVDLDLEPASGAPPPPRVEQPSPRPGETWAMHVLIEHESEDEIRYVIVDANGQPYGAPRVLKNAHFHGTFQQVQGRHQILVEVLSAAPQCVTYARRDSQGVRIGETKTLPFSSFVANFILENGKPR